MGNYYSKKTLEELPKNSIDLLIIEGFNIEKEEFLKKLKEKKIEEEKDNLEVISNNIKKMDYLINKNKKRQPFLIYSFVNILLEKLDFKIEGEKKEEKNNFELELEKLVMEDKKNKNFLIIDKFLLKNKIIEFLKKNKFLKDDKEKEKKIKIDFNKEFLLEKNKNLEKMFENLKLSFKKLKKENKKNNEEKIELEIKNYNLLQIQKKKFRGKKKKK